MNLKGIGFYIGRRVVEGKENRRYTFLKFVDEIGSELELQLPEGEPLPNMEQFKKYQFIAEIVQGKYPRYFLREYADTK